MAEEPQPTLTASVQLAGGPCALDAGPEEGTLAAAAYCHDPRYACRGGGVAAIEVGGGNPLVASFHPLAGAFDARWWREKGAILAVGDEGKVATLPMASIRREGGVVRAFQRGALATSVAPPGVALASSGQAASVDPERGDVLRRWMAHDAEGWTADCSGSFGVILTGGDDGALRAWDARTKGPEEVAVREHPAGVCSARLVKGEGSVVTGCYDGRVRWLDLRAGLAPRRWAVGGREAGVWQVAVNEVDGSVIAASTFDGAACLDVHGNALWRHTAGKGALLTYGAAWTSDARAAVADFSPAEISLFSHPVGGGGG